MAQAAYNSVNRSQQVTNGKLKALYAVKAAEEATPEFFIILKIIWIYLIYISWIILMMVLLSA